MDGFGETTGPRDISDLLLECTTCCDLCKRTYTEICYMCSLSCNQCQNEEPLTKGGKFAMFEVQLSIQKFILLLYVQMLQIKIEESSHDYQKNPGAFSSRGFTDLLWKVL